MRITRIKLLSISNVERLSKVRVTTTSFNAAYTWQCEKSCGDEGKEEEKSERNNNMKSVSLSCSTATQAKTRQVE